jgi:hypothetical protein
MRAGFIRRQLRQAPILHLVTGLIVMTVFTPCLLGMALQVFRGVPASHFLMPQLIFSGVWVFAMGVATWGGWQLYHLDDHPDWRALARYGPPWQVAEAIDAELANPEHVARIGERIRSLRPITQRTMELNCCQVLLTPSWLIYLWGGPSRRVAVQRVQDLVVVHRTDTRVNDKYGRLIPGLLATCIDRHNVRLDVVGTEEGVGRLLAQVLMRVPWALDRFDASTERTLRENPEQIIAELDRRRDERIH